MVPALRTLGFGIPIIPQGAFYIYADCAQVGQNSADFALSLLENAGVAITPGIDFGVHRAERHVRFAYTRALQDLQEGVQRIAQYLGTRPPG